MRKLSAFIQKTQYLACWYTATDISLLKCVRDMLELEEFRAWTVLMVHCNCCAASVSARICEGRLSARKSLGKTSMAVRTQAVRISQIVDLRSRPGPQLFF